MSTRGFLGERGRERERERERFIREEETEGSRVLERERVRERLHIRNGKLRDCWSGASPGDMQKW